jgi:hypothetical protein
LYLSIIVVAAVVIAISDIAIADEHGIRGPSRAAWVLVVIIVPLVGCIAWFVAGRPLGVAPPRTTRFAGAFPQYDSLGRPGEEFVQQCRQRAEQQRRIAREGRASREQREEA